MSGVETTPCLMWAAFAISCTVASQAYEAARACWCCSGHKDPPNAEEDAPAPLPAPSPHGQRPLLALPPPHTDVDGPKGELVLPPPPLYPPSEDETDVPGNTRLNQAPAKDEEDAGKASTDIYEALAKRPGDELTPPAPSPKEDTNNDTADITVCTAVPVRRLFTVVRCMQWLSLLIFAAMAYNLRLENSSLHAALQYMASMAIVSVDSFTNTIERTFGASQAPEPIPQTWESLIQEVMVYVQSAFQGE